MFVAYVSDLKTIVVAAETTGRFEKYKENILDCIPGVLSASSFISAHEAEEIDLLLEPDFQGMMVLPLIIIHPSAEAQKEFIKKGGLMILSRLEAIAYQSRMIAGDDIGPEPDDDVPIGKYTGTFENDPWDTRSEKERQQDRAAQNRAKKTRSDVHESFDSNEQSVVKSGAKVTDIRVSETKDGKITVDSAIAVKYGANASPEDAVQTIGEIEKIKNEPRPWNARSVEFSAMDADTRTETLKSITPDEFIFAGTAVYNGLLVFIVPADWFRTHGTLWGDSLEINHLLPKELKEVSPGQYLTNMSWLELTQIMAQKGFRESIMELNLYINAAMP